MELVTPLNTIPYAVLRDILAELIQDEGLIEVRVHHLFGVADSSFSTVNPEKIIEDIKLVLSSIIADKSKIALEYAFGLEGQVRYNGGLSDRRAELREKGGVFNVSVDTLRRWESRALELLAVKITTWV